MWDLFVRALREREREREREKEYVDLRQLKIKVVFMGISRVSFP